MPDDSDIIEEHEEEIPGEDGKKIKRIIRTIKKKEAR